MRLVLPLIFLSAAACAGASPGTQTAPSVQTEPSSPYLDPAPPEGEHETAILAGGCFWCIESAFDDVPGVIDAVSGYTGGVEPTPSYRDVSSGRTSHLEAVRVRYDPSRLSYAEVLDIFWRQIDPTDDGGQFADRGHHYTTAIFVLDDAQRAAARASRDALAKSGRFDEPIVTPIRDASAFHVAEEYHQDYHRKNPAHYQRYRWGSGRGPFLAKVWGADDH